MSPKQIIEALIADATPIPAIFEKTPSDLKIVEEEMKLVPMSRLQRAQIARKMAKAVGVPVKDLLLSITPKNAEAKPGRELSLVDHTEPWDGEVNGVELLKELYALIKRPLWISDAARMTVALWIIAEYAFKAFHRFPYLRIKSADKNCGKSTLVDLLALLAYNPIVAADVTPAALYRTAEEFAPTMLFDEFDNPDQIKELTQLFNAGYDRNRVALRFNNERGVLEQFRTYCPKVIASIKELADTTESRALCIDMVRVPANAEKALEELCDIDRALFTVLKRKILGFTQDHWAEFETLRPTRPEWLKTRDWDIWRPLFLVAEIIGKAGWARSAAHGLFEHRVIEESLAIEILSHIRAAVKTSFVPMEAKTDNRGGSFLPSEKLVEYCNADQEASWADWKTGDKTGLTMKRLAKVLRQDFKVKSDRAWEPLQLKKVSGYWLKDLEPAFESFLPPEDEPSPDNPSDTVLQKEKNTDPPEKGPVSCHKPVSASEQDTSSGRMQENNPAIGRVQTPNPAIGSGSKSAMYEVVAGYSPVFGGVCENLFLAIDVETSAELRVARKGSPPKTKISSDALDPHKAQLCALSIADSAGNITVHDFARQGPLPDYLRAAIATQPLIAHGAGFDLAVLGANGYATSPEVFCTLTAGRLLSAGLPEDNDLGSLLKRHCQIELPKELGASDFGGLFLTQAQIEYCRNDVAHLHVATATLQQKLANPADGNGDGAEGVDLVRIAKLEMALIPLVVDIQLKGIRVDRAQLEKLLAARQVQKKDEAARLRAELSSPKLNFASPEQLLKALAKLGIDLKGTSKEELSECPHPLAGRILGFRQLSGTCTTLSSWLELLDGNNRLYPPLNPLGAETGRFSCKKPNLLAVSRDPEVRAIFLPDSEDYVFIENDYRNIEMCVGAWFCQEPLMLSIFQAGGDIHLKTASEILRDVKARQAAKPVNFNNIYGGSAERLRATARMEYGIEFSPEQAKEYHEGFFRLYPHFRRWHEAAKAAADELTYGATAYGRRRWADPADRADKWDWNRFQLATNFEVQGVCADGLKVALIELYKIIGTYGGRIVLPVHDSILAQVPRDQAQKLSTIIGELMCDSFHKILGPDFPVAVETKISSRWGGKEEK